MRGRKVGSKNRYFSPKGRGREIDDSFLVNEYVVNRKNCSLIAKENGWCWQTVKYRLKRLGVYQGDTRERDKGFVRSAEVHTGSCV